MPSVIQKTKIIAAVLAVLESSAHSDISMYANGSCAGNHCTQRTQSESNILIQARLGLIAKKLGLDHKGSRSKALDAQFLMQATFGPTQTSLGEVQQSESYQHWIKNQIDRVPAESHRAYFRTRANPHWDLVDVKTDAFSLLPTCSQGSRWYGYVFKRIQSGMQVKVTDGQILIGEDEVWIADIDASISAPSTCLDTPDSGMIRKSWTCQSKVKKHWCARTKWLENKYCQQTCHDLGAGYPGDDCSGGWAKYATENTELRICSVEEHLGGAVSFCKDMTKDCAKCSEFVYKKNPAIWVAESGDEPGYVEKGKSFFVENPAIRDVIFKATTQSSSACGLTNSSTVKYQGSYYRHDSRVRLLDNSVGNPQISSSAANPGKNFFNKHDCKLLKKGQGGYVACGSPGEVGNVPEQGNYFTFVTNYISLPGQEKHRRDTYLDSDNLLSRALLVQKSAVWFMKAFQANDQLRQRMAWALSQIIVVGVPGLTEQSKYTESWLNFFDIFVRNAFGSFRDILQEVTYSPMMATYLTYQGSRPFDTSGSYPDENYAREIMQLFTVGVDMLHNNGSVLQDEDGVEVPAYTNENIMNFARVLTGFRWSKVRANLEVPPNTFKNYIDPLVLIAKNHDRYPKPDLYGGYLGDGYPLCADIPKGAFLRKGATYEFLSYTSNSEAALSLDEDSELGKLLADISLTITLDEDVACSGEECLLDTVDVVRIKGGVYEYVAPTCVHHFFYNGIGLLNKDRKKKECEHPDAAAAGVQCCKGCTDKPTKWMKQRGITCANADTMWLKKGKPVMFQKFCNKNNNWRKHQYCMYTCAQDGLPYEGSDCSEGHYVEQLQCGSMHERISWSSAQAICKGKKMGICPYKAEGKCGSKEIRFWSGQSCPTEVVVHSDGKVSAHTENHAQNKFAVHWGFNDAPEAGKYMATVTHEKVFTVVPNKEDLTKLTMSAFKPTTDCTHCYGEVKVFLDATDSVNENTIFEYSGKFYKNAESLVVLDGSHTFRNPPVFIRPGSAGIDQSGRALERAAYAEVESLIDHLFYHPNTPVNIGKKLIQRFVTSNPSAAYTEAVADAFRSGTYDGTSYTGKYGDLGATIVAILLYPEAREQDKPKDGLLREPILRLVHFMRAMEYKDWSNDPIVFRQMDELIGQFPYYSATVFNFYYADFMPAGVGMQSKPEPEPEPEPEPLLAPEFQIFTPPFWLNLLNGFDSLIKNGVSNCDEGFGVSDSRPGCQRGNLSFQPEKSDPEDAVAELDVLLTGERLTGENKDIVKSAYESAGEGEKVRAAQQAILLTPEFNNLGIPQPSGTRTHEKKKDEHDPQPYKAVVMVFLAGGADTYQLLVPRDCALHNDYRERRKGINLKIEDLLSISAPTQKCKDFGINPSMPKLHKLYQDGHAAFISNIGGLVEPTTRQQLKGGATKTCPSQFSHSHAQATAQTTQCTGAANVPRGIGGLMADYLEVKGMNVASFSVAGMATWSQGENTSIEILDKSRGAIRFQAYQQWKDAISKISSQKHGNYYCDEYSRALGNAINSSETYGNFLDKINRPSLETYKTDNALSQQLHQVARIIATRTDRKAERDFFFVQLGGWDHHSSIATSLPDKLKVVDNAISGFVDELKSQTIFNSVVLMTESDFGRTLTFNGAGTDHGWGGNHIVVGGDIEGGQVYNDFLETFQEDSDYDAGRGRVIPKYPWENMMVPIARWVGVDEPHKIFPNLGKFNTSLHIISSTDLFKSL